MSASSAPSLEYIIEGILPVREVHFIAGPSGSGKTTWMFQLIDHIRKGEKVLGYQSIPIPMCYVACDRSDAGIKRTLKRMGINNTIPYFSALKQVGMTVETLIVKARELVPQCKLLFIDAFGRLTPDGEIREYGNVSGFLTFCVNLCERYDITIIALTHSPKCKEGERYVNPRQRLMGSVAWAGFCETIFLIEPDEADPELRTLYLLPRNEPETEFTYAFNDQGRMEETNPDAPVYEALEVHVWSLLKTGHFYTRLEIAELAGQQQIKCSLKTIQRWLKAKLKDGYLRQPKRGSYERVLPS